jgi:hypothetical protein
VETLHIASICTSSPPAISSNICSSTAFRVVDRPGRSATELARTVRRDEGPRRRAPAALGRATFAKGLSIPVGADVVVPLDGRAGRFRAEVGPELGVRPGTPGVRASLVVDGRVARVDPWLRVGDEPAVLAAEGLASAKEATIRVRSGVAGRLLVRVVVGNAWFFR